MPYLTNRKTVVGRTLVVMPSRETRMKSIFLTACALLATALAGCSNFPGADGRYATHDRGAGNRGMARTGLPPVPYIPN